MPIIDDTDRYRAARRVAKKAKRKGWGKAKARRRLSLRLGFLGAWRIVSAAPIWRKSRSHNLRRAGEIIEEMFT